MKNKIKKWFFKTCPKSGRIVGINKKNVVLKICFPLLGLAALVWFLIRVVPKPSRMEYPCQQVAAPIALSFVAFISSTLVGVGTWKRVRNLWNARRVTLGLSVLLIGVLASGTLYVMSVDNSLMGQVIRKQIDNGTDMGRFIPIDAPNTPMGVAKGIHPGRVAWAYDPKAAAWDGKHGLYSDADNNSQTRVNDMLEGVIIALTNQKTIDKAWDELFRLFNYKKGKGAVSYKKGEKIAIKVNLNDNGGSNIIDATPQSVYALLHQLIDIMQVPQNNITVYDAQRRGISAIYDYMQPLYPEVNYQNWGGFVPDVVHYSSEITDKGSMSLARAAYEADYMINMALMKRHSEPTDKWRDSAGQTGITSTGKNQFGSLEKVPPLHFSIRDWSSFRGMGTYNCIVDLMAHERIGGNTLVYIVDAMYVNPKHNGHAVRFKRAPFNNGWTSSFLASNDQVAIESVVLDFIYSELPLPANADNFLHEAANIGNPPSGIAYAGKKLVSLGVHEHWNNPEQRMYSRNLGTGKGIELYRVPLDENRAAIEYFYADGTTLHYKVSNADEVRLNNMKLDNTEGHLCVGVDKTTDYRLEAIKHDKVVATQRLVLRNLQPIITCQTKEMLLNGSATINEDGSVEFKGEKGSSNGFIAWKAEIPYTGKYYLDISYEGGNPVPSYLYANGKLISENIGYLATTGNKRGNFIFPIDLEKGVNELRLEHPGRRSNKLYTITIAKEIN
ncbi:DUF362 domain-containing protein [Bacteroides clarus]|jgi:hypothetical protein|uniref:Conserved domain protein n=2 Tax=Bacteroides clarus TaxID=626929 RepID=A0ABN0CLC0_9BACE|nr:DUF362 domain-containing protein [Bacteroides clarus]EGF50687.1 conserved domain protein [Bacteroides clarus YIT 12056]OUP33935.1 DUF362 domain-containing protein [Bacteroides clarus]SHG26784.1 protein of unknown function [Bacteroides clarus YIT 12056]